jgi:hypothetical protein
MTLACVPLTQRGDLEEVSYVGIAHGGLQPKTHPTLMTEFYIPKRWAKGIWDRVMGNSVVQQAQRPVLKVNKPRAYMVWYKWEHRYCTTCLDWGCLSLSRLRLLTCCCRLAEA